MSATDAIGPIRHTLSDETRRILSAPLFTNTHISIVEKMCIITVIQGNLDWISSLMIILQHLLSRFQVISAQFYLHKTNVLLFSFSESEQSDTKCAPWSLFASCKGIIMLCSCPNVN